MFKAYRIQKVVHFLFLRCYEIETVQSYLKPPIKRKAPIRETCRAPKPRLHKIELD